MKNDIKKSFSCDNLFVVGKHTCCEMDGSGGVDNVIFVCAQHSEPVGRVLHLRDCCESQKGMDVSFVFNQL